MTTTPEANHEGAVFDLGYRPYEGVRKGRGAAFRSLLRDGLRRVLGLRRRTRRKVLPFSLMATAVLPALFFVALGVFTSQFEMGEVEFFSHSQYFNMTGSIALLFIALAAGELLVPDRQHGTLALYSSRPLTVTDYLAGRGTALVIVVFIFMYLPHLVLFIGQAWVSDAGFLSHAGENLDVLWETAAASGVYILAYGSLAFAVAAFAKRAGMSAGIFLLILMTSTPAVAALVDEVDIKTAGLGALIDHPGYVKDWIMGTDTDHWIAERAGYEPIVALLVVLGVAAACGAAVFYRYRRLT
jgi:ABC-2 type transport system permease protein